MKESLKNYYLQMKPPYKWKNIPTIVVMLTLLLSLPLTLIVSRQQQNYLQKAKAATEISVQGLHVVGNQIQNSQGQPIQMLGVNRSSFEYACSEGWGIFEGPADQSEISAMKAWGINSVRVVLNEDCWLGIHGINASYSGIVYQNAVASYVALLNQNNISAIVNLHFNGNGTSKAVEQEPMADRANSNTFWTSVASRFKDNSAVMFEPYNEPHDITWQCWRDGGTCQGVSFQVAGMQEMTNAIRATGATNIIIATGNDWGADLSQWVQYKPTDPINQLAAGWHTYGDGLSCQTLSCWNTELTNVLTVAPIVATEIGQFDCKHDYIDQVMNFLDSKGQGYYAWVWGPHNCAKDPALLTNWTGSASQTFGQGYKDHLLQRIQVPTPTTGNNPTGVPTPSLTPEPTTTVSTPTPTSVPVSTSTPNPTIPQTAALNIYTDALASNWVNGSWNATVNFASTAQVYQGQKSIAFTLTKAWGGLEFDVNPGTVNTNPYTHLTFAAKATQAGQKYSVFLSNANWTELKAPLSLANYGGNPNPTNWTVYKIPLSALNGVNKNIKAITIHDDKGGAQPPVYIDQVQLIKQ